MFLLIQGEVYEHGTVDSIFNNNLFINWKSGVTLARSPKSLYAKINGFKGHQMMQSVFDQLLSYFVGFMHLLQRPLLRIHKQNGTYQLWAKVGVTLAQHVITNITVFN